MKVAYPFLGTCWSGRSSGTRCRAAVNSFDTWSARYFDRDDPWQFANFQL